MDISNLSLQFRLTRSARFEEQSRAHLSRKINRHSSKSASERRTETEKRSAVEKGKLIPMTRRLLSLHFVPRSWIHLIRSPSLGIETMTEGCDARTSFLQCKSVLQDMRGLFSKVTKFSMIRCLPIENCGNLETCRVKISTPRPASRDIGPRKRTTILSDRREHPLYSDPISFVHLRSSPSNTAAVLSQSRTLGWRRGHCHANI